MTTPLGSRTKSCQSLKSGMFIWRHSQRFLMNVCFISSKPCALSAMWSTGEVRWLYL